VSDPNPGGYVAESAGLLRDHPDMGRAVAESSRSFDFRRAEAYGQVDSEAWRHWARGVKDHTLTNLHGYLREAEERLQENGARVHWAVDAGEALAVLGAVVQTNGIKRAVKAKSMLTEEIQVNGFLEDLGVRIRETDLGEYIIQLLGEAPSHIVAPAIHRSVEDCQRLFNEELGTPPNADPDELAAAARRALREEFLSADLGISGGNFLVAETGTLALVENEGNIRLSTSLPRVHVAFVGIEKLLPRLEDLSGFLQLVARAATGQPIGTYVSLIQGPRQEEEPDGPEELHVVLVDNGRSRLLTEDRAWEALRCIRCGACLNTCPVFQRTGGHPYGWAYSGPIGSILAPGLLGLKEGLPLPYVSTLCGACADVCPVEIPIPDLLLYWRQRAVAEGHASRIERMAMRGFAMASERPGLFHAAGGLLRRIPWQLGGKALPALHSWASARGPLVPSARSFRDLWKEGIE
jgi:L-lactate dehydrogenase complex protein LldF